MIKFKDRELEAKEITYLQAVEFDGLEKSEVAKRMLKYSLGLTDEEIEGLSLKEGLRLQEEVNKVNDLSDFQKPTVENQS